MANYSPYKMKGHTLPGIKQRKSPAKKELVGGQHNLPAELKAKIEAAPTKMYGKKSPTKDIQTFEASDSAEKWNAVTSHNEAHRAEKTKKKEKSPAKIAPLVAMAGKAILGKVAGKVAGKVL